MTQNRVVAVIPARNDAQRFPGKPLVQIDGVPMVVRVARQVARAETIESVRVATDDVRIQAVVMQAGFSAEMTPKSCPTGSDRVATLVKRWTEPPQLVVNVQCDEPLIDPADLDALVVDTLDKDGAIGTLARPLSDEADFHDPHVVKVVRDGTGRALYFSRAPIPYGAPSAALQHVGVYAFSPDVLFRYAALSPGRLEGVERLEQLRAMENGIPIYVTMCVSQRPSIAVDVPADVEAVMRELSRHPRAGPTGSAD